MGQQLNKIQKRKRRVSYLNRKKDAAKAKVKAKVKTTKKA